MECLVYNVPNHLFGATSYVQDFLSVTQQIWYRTSEPERCDEWLEVNDLKYLFRGDAWDRGQANELAWSAYYAVKQG